MFPTQALNTFSKAIDRVMKEPPGPSRWLEARKLWFSLNPDNPTINRMCAEDNAEFRRNIVKNKKSNWKAAYRLPVGAKYAIERADPQAFSRDNEKKFIRT